MTERTTRANRLTARQYDLLAMLHRTDGGCTASELAELLRLSRSATSELINRAQRAKLVLRRPDRADGRVKHVTPTAEGTRRYLKAATQLAPERQQLLASICRNA